MRRPTLSVSGWFAAVCLLGTAVWACSSDETDLFEEGTRGGAGGSSGSDTGGSDVGGTAGSSSGGSSGGSDTGGSTTGGSSTGGEATGGTTTGGSTGDGGAAADAGTDSGGTTTGGSAGMPGGAGSGTGAGNGGTPPVGGAGMGGMVGGAGTGGAGAGGAGTGGTGKGGSGGGPGGCREDGDCKSTQYCKKATCDAPSGECTPRGPECRGMNAEFEPVCGCDSITYWNECAIANEGQNVAAKGECTGSDRPTCTRDGGGDSCPERSHVHCYRPMDACGNTSPTMGVCWVLPAECPEDEPQTTRYCGGTSGSARCIGLCEVIEAENTFERDAARCAN